MAQSKKSTFEMFDTVLLNDEKLPNEKELFNCFPEIKQWKEQTKNSTIKRKRQALLEDSNVHLERYSLEELLELQRR